MSDELALPVLAASVLTQAFGFLYGRLSAALDRRANRAQDDELTPPEVPPALIGELAMPLQVREEAFTAERLTRLNMLNDLLSVYHENPDLIRVGDERLRRNLGQLRQDLEALYGQRFTFEGEQRPATGVLVDQQFDVHRGDNVGLEIDEVSAEANVEIQQSFEQTMPGSRNIGGKFGRLG